MQKHRVALQLVPQQVAAEVHTITHITFEAALAACKECIAAAAAERKKQKALVTEPTVAFKVISSVSDDYCPATQQPSSQSHYLCQSLNLLVCLGPWKT